MHLAAIACCKGPQDLRRFSLELGEGSSTAALDVPAFDGPSVSDLRICDPTGLDSQEREELLRLQCVLGLSEDYRCG